MNVLIIHEHGRSFGSGGVIAMYRLHQALREAGVNSTIACRRKAIESDDVVELPRSDRLEDLLGRFTWRIGLNEIHCLSTFKLATFEPFLKADVVNIHGMHGNFFNYLALPRLAREKPIVRTMHDMWMLTGHCSQSYDCRRWKIGCGQCPYLETYPPVSRDATRIEFQLKQWVYRRSPMAVVSPSQWLAGLARQSMLRHLPIYHIPNGVDTEVFRPRDPQQSRADLKLPQDRLIVMFASAALSLPGKGSDLLISALTGLSNDCMRRILLLLIGDRGEELTRLLDFPAVHLGYLREDEEKARAYSAADVFVLPSRAENHSLVLLEAMACGTPCVAFDVGGNREIIREGENGCLALPENPSDLRAALLRLLSDDSTRASMRRSARDTITREFTLERHTQRYIQLFEQVIRSHKRSGTTH